MEPSKILIEHIQQAEGLRLQAYRDCGKGIYTIGYGHTGGVKKGMIITERYADNLLMIDLRPICTYLSTIRQINTQGKFDACADFIYNVGITNFKKSTLLKKILAEAPTKDILTQFRKWIYSGKNILPGLVTRREWECDRWQQE